MATRRLGKELVGALKERGAWAPPGRPRQRRTRYRPHEVRCAAKARSRAHRQLRRWTNRPFTSARERQECEDARASCRAAAEAHRKVSRRWRAQCWAAFTQQLAGKMRHPIAKAGVYRFARRQTKGGQSCNPADTVRIRGGDRLSTNAEEAVAQFAAHFAALAGDDEGAQSEVTAANCEHWRAVLQEFWRRPSQRSRGRRSVLDVVPLAPDRETWAEAPLEGLDHDFTWTELLDILKQLHYGKATGLDGIPYDVLKATVQRYERDQGPELRRGGTLTDLVAELLNAIFQTAHIPNVPSWRVARCLPLPKRGDLADCSNYRGISLMNCILKILLKAMATRLARHAGTVRPAGALAGRLPPAPRLRPLACLCL